MQNEAKRKIQEAKRNEKMYAKFSLIHEKQKRNKTRYASFHFKAKKIEAKPAHPTGRWGGGGTGPGPS